MQEIKKRRKESENRLNEIEHKLANASKTLKGKACVYATGSFGRHEASKHSDLDLFIVGKTKATESKNEFPSELSRLDEICVKADLIEQTRLLGIPDFDGDGRYLTNYSVGQLTQTMGRADDDASNTFTARLLLLLESTPLLRPDVYQDIIDEVVAAYWRDYEDHKSDFVPAYLANDIMRLWRTFCVNYEARTEREPAEKKAKGKLKNYKLKHSRLLTCYSAILFLMVKYNQHNAVAPSDMIEMVGMIPLDRLTWVGNNAGIIKVKDQVIKLQNSYNTFLEKTNEEELALIIKFTDPGMTNELQSEADLFGEHMFEAVQALGNGNKLHRMLLV